ncbi:MAG TPA: ABC transporter permease [Vicinamibacterales bacterium]
MRLNHIVRRLLQMPVFTGIAILTLAIGIGANAAIFSVVDGVLLKPLPYPKPDELVVLDHSAVGLNIQHAGSAPFLYFTYRENGGKTFQDVAMWTGDAVTVTGVAEPEEVRAVDVTDGMLPMLGVRPLFGRVFTAQDDSPAGVETVVLSAGYWRSRLGGEPSAVGRRIMLDGTAREIIGVLPDSFRFLDQKPSMFLPLRFDRAKVRLGNFSYTAVARIRPGVTLDHVTAETTRLIPLAMTSFPPFPGMNVQMFTDARITPTPRALKDEVVGDVGPVLWVLMGTIGMVLLIACANVANLLLVRAEGRRQELAVRAALGASRGRIAYELLAESVVLGLVGGVAGLGLAYGAVRALLGLAPGNLPRLDNIAIDPSVLAFTFGISIVAGLLFGIIPVFKYAGPDVASGLRGGGRTSSASRERHRARSILVIVQVALALVLLVGSGLMIRTFVALRQVEPGFRDPEEILTFSLAIPEAQVKDAEPVVRMYQAILDKIATVPGVTSVAVTSVVPMTSSGWHDAIFASDKTYGEGELPPMRLFKFLSPGLLKTMGNTLVAGRDFTWSDVYDKHPVVMVSENVARELWKEPAMAIGKQVRENPTSAWREVIGVVGDERDEGVDKNASSIAFWPVMMSHFSGTEPFVRRNVSFAIRSKRTGASAFTEEVSRAVWAVNPNLPLARVRPLDAIVSASMARTSFTLVMLAIAGVMALVLGVAGIYGVISYSVSQRTREIGIRMALGAQRREVTGLFVRHGLRLVAVGIVSGLAAALALTRLMRSLLFEVNPVDPITYVGVCLSLAAAAVLASYIPALRATSVNPVTALRAD